MSAVASPVAEAIHTFDVVSPQAHRLLTNRGVTALESLEGVTLGVLCNSKPNAQVLLDAVVEGLQERATLAGVVRDSKPIPSSAAPAEVYANLAGRVGAALFASADCGSCTSWGIHDTAELEKRGVPTVCLVAHPFVPMAKAQSIALEYPELRTVVFEGPIAGMPEEAVREKAAAIIDDVVAAFIR